MSKRVVAGSAVLVALAAVAELVRRPRRKRTAAAERLAAIDRRVIDTEFGPLEYAEEGSGEPVLVSHGIFHGCDGGLLSARDLVDDRRIIAPSRFGYLGSALPARPSAAAQADAFVALLDHLELDTVDVIAISAGTSAAVRLALRHPGRVRHLVISSGSFPGSTTAAPPPAWAKIFYSDRAMGMLETLARPMFARLMGVPKGFPRNADDRRAMDRMLVSIFPVDPRAPGATFDAYVGNPEINDCPLEEMRVPALLVHAKDDPLASYDAAVNASRRIPGSVLLSLESGGHLQLGQTERVRAAVAAFLDGSGGA